MEDVNEDGLEPEDCGAWLLDGDDNPEPERSVSDEHNRHPPDVFTSMHRCVKSFSVS